MYNNLININCVHKKKNLKKKHTHKKKYKQTKNYKKTHAELEYQCLSMVHSNTAIYFTYKCVCFKAPHTPRPVKRKKEEEKRDLWTTKKRKRKKKKEEKKVKSWVCRQFTFTHTQKYFNLQYTLTSKKAKLMCLQHTINWNNFNW